MKEHEIDGAIYLSIPPWGLFFSHRLPKNPIDYPGESRKYAFTHDMLFPYSKPTVSESA